MADKAGKITVAIAGNPNAGKTTLFNNLTGARQHVGNWPGVTVEKKEGTSRYGDYRFEVVDLPGTYSLTAYSLEEVIVRDYITGEKPDVVIDIVDASNIERNLYLTTQLMELGVPVIAALNMMDVAKSRGIDINIELLSELLGIPVVPMVCLRNRGTDELKSTVVSVIKGEAKFRGIHVDYGKEVEEEIEKLEGVIEDERAALSEYLGKYSTRWLAVKLLEEDEAVVENLSEYLEPDSALFRRQEQSLKHLFSIFSEDVETVIVDYRYGFVAGTAREAVKREFEEPVSTSDRIDNILTNRILGFPFFAFFMWSMFFLTFFLGKIPMDWIEQIFGGISNFIATNLTSPIWLQSLLADGVIGGVGAVLVFLPQIFIIFLCISILEDTGYMARAAFIMDRVMHWLGLHGK
ncbi:MAG: ferrous iron transport protein B, partial [Actinomycetia bacterium]|nr:ferrous iron transport protein B [Actinomycetes bacterium]